jgi:hypothetical protein
MNPLDPFETQLRRLTPVAPENVQQVFYQAGFEAAMAQRAPSRRLRFTSGLLAGTAASVLLMLAMSSMRVTSTKTADQPPSRTSVESIADLQTMDSNAIAEDPKSKPSPTKTQNQPVESLPVIETPLRSLLVSTHAKHRLGLLGLVDKEWGPLAIGDSQLYRQSSRFKDHTVELDSESNEIQARDPILKAYPSTIHLR